MTKQKQQELSSQHGVEFSAFEADRIELHKDVQRERMRAYLHFMGGLVSIIFSLLGTVLVAIGVSVSSSSLQIPKPYVYLIGVIVSSLAGISIIFFFAWRIYHRRKKEGVAAIDGIRTTEQQLFKLLQLDFESMLKAHNLDAESTVRSN